MVTTLSTACSSAANAIMLGARLIRHGYLDTVLVGGTEDVYKRQIVDPDTQNVYHGGNFHGDYVSFERDKLKIAVTKLTMLAERCV